VPEIHANREVAIAPIRGTFKGPIFLEVTSFSRLTIVAPLSLIPDLFALCGRVISIGEAQVLLGRMTLSPITPCDAAGSRLVAFSFPDRTEITAENFMTEVRRQLGILGIEAEPVLGKRRVFKVKGFKQVGYGLRFEDLQPPASLRLQYEGLGGHRRFGCGVFTPIRKADPT